MHLIKQLAFSPADRFQFPVHGMSRLKWKFTQKWRRHLHAIEIWFNQFGRLHIKRRQKVALCSRSKVAIAIGLYVFDYATHAVHDVELRSGGQNGTKKFWRSRCDGRFGGGQTLLQAVGRIVAEQFEAELCKNFCIWEIPICLAGDWLHTHTRRLNEKGKYVRGWRLNVNAFYRKFISH